MTDQEQVRLWTWCGFEKTVHLNNHSGVIGPYWRLPDKSNFYSLLPNPTLDNLFRWVVPRIRGLADIDLCPHNNRWHCEIDIAPADGSDYKTFSATADDPAEALAQAMKSLNDS